MESVSITFEKDTTPIAGEWFKRYQFSSSFRLTIIFIGKFTTPNYQTHGFQNSFQLTKFICSADIERMITKPDTSLCEESVKLLLINVRD